MIAVADLAAAVGGTLTGDATIEINSVTHDSRQAGPGTLFACIDGATVDGHNFAQGAVEQGAAALLVQRILEVAAPQILVADSRRSMGSAAAEVYEHPDRDVVVLGVTGTNGKTTVTHMLGSMLTKLGRSVDVLGTLSGARTTPEAPELFRTLAQMRGNGVQNLAMEVSSHALELHRVEGLRFAVAAFTNLTQDHLDFHPTMADYFEAKARLFTTEQSERAVINRDDPYGRELLNRREDASSYSIDDAEDLHLEGATATFAWHGRPVTLQMAGVHNVSNAICAATMLDVLGYEADDIADALGAIDPVPGRMEWVSVGQPFRIAVDYSHTPDSIRVALAACRIAADGDAQVIVVFGCGGDRDRDKRPLMGAEAAQGADRVIVTSDNPRSEDPDEIIAQILTGVPDGTTVEVEPDRRAAIALAVANARDGDVILIAGKGHETTQTIGDDAIEFDDRMVAVEAISAMGR